jgi:adenylate cyclase
MDHQTQTRAVLFADVSGSTHLYESLGDGEALACVTRCLAIMRDATLGHGGRVVRTMGDELLCVFADATDAARAAAAMQALIACEDPVRGEGRALPIRAHIGPRKQPHQHFFFDKL